MSCEKKCCPDRRKRLIWRISYSALNVFIGLSIFYTFGFEYHDVHAALWGLLCGLFAAVAMVVNILEFRSVWLTRRWLAPLLVTMVIGIVGAVAALTAFVVYITIASYNHEDLIIYGNSNWMGAVWAFMTIKWSSLTAVYSWWYYRRLKFGAAPPEPETADVTASAAGASAAYSRI